MDDEKKKTLWNVGKFLLKLLISAVALYFVFKKVNFRETFEKISTINILPYVLSLAVFNISKIISTWRVKYFLRALRQEITTGFNIKLYYIGAFYNLYLPGSIGGDGYKVWLLKKRFASPTRKLISVVFLDRLSGMVALTFLTLPMLFFSSYLPPIPGWNWILLALILLVYPVYYFLFTRFFADFKPAFHTSNIASFITQALQVVCAWLILIALGDTHGNIWDYLALFMIAGVISIVPLTIGGFGAREAVLAFGAHHLMIDEKTAVSLALLFSFVTAVSSLAGLVFVFSRNKDESKSGETAAG